MWYSGPDRPASSLLGTQGESDIIRNGADTWTWNSKSGTAQPFKGNAGDAAKAGGPAAVPSEIPKTPQEAADLALKAIDPTTQVSIGNSAKIAGRDAYELILRPRDTASLIGQVRLAIDAQEHLPLRVQILAKGNSNPAFEVAFTQVSFARPDDGQFVFNPPAGTKVEEADPAAAGAEGQPKVDESASGEKPKSAVIGTGWTSVFVLRTGTPGGRGHRRGGEEGSGRHQPAPAGQRRPDVQQQAVQRPHHRRRPGPGRRGEPRASLAGGRRPGSRTEVRFSIS